jgi:Flp pilus assembly protein CpaB
MEFEIRDDRNRGRAVMAVGLLLALVAGGAGYYLLSRAQQEAANTEIARVPAVVAVRAIPARTAIASEDVEVRQVPLDDSNAAGVATEPAQVIGRIPAVTILQGQLITTNMLASSSEGARFSILGPEETVSPDSEAWRAVSITVPDDLAVGGLLAAGQTVDVFVTAIVSVPTDLTQDGEFYTDRSTKIVYQDMLILAREDAFYVVRASLPVAEEIVHLQAAGTTTFSLVLRPDIDLRTADATALGTTTNRIIEKYGLPVPEQLDGGAVNGVPPIPSPTPTPSPTASPSASPSPGPSESPAASQVP